MSEPNFELYWVTFQLPKFGSDGKEFDEHKWHMGVSTSGGRKDAEDACKKYHSGCKVLCVLSRLEELAGVERQVTEAREANSKSKQSSKKGKKK